MRIKRDERAKKGQSTISSKQKGRVVNTMALNQTQGVSFVTSAVIESDGFDFLETGVGLVFEEVRELCEGRGSLVPLPKSINQSEDLFERATEVFETDSMFFFIGKSFA